MTYLFSCKLNPFPKPPLPPVFGASIDTSTGAVGEWPAGTAHPGMPHVNAQDDRSRAEP